MQVASIIEGFCISKSTFYNFTYTFILLSPHAYQINQQHPAVKKISFQEKLHTFWGAGFLWLFWVRNS